MLELLSLAGGALTRLLPEVVSYFKEKEKAKERIEDRKHELAMLELNGKLAVQGHQFRMEAANLEADVELFKAGVDATKPISGQLKAATGVRWVDGTVALLGALVDVFNASIRPLITVWWVLVMYTLVKAAQFQQMQAQGAEWFAAAQALWTAQDAAVTMSIIGFWFTDRVLRHYAGK